VSDPAQVGTDRPEGGDVRSAGPVRRFLFHAGLSALASPLPGGLLVASRLLAAGRPLYALATASSAAAATATVVLAAFLLPASAPAAFAVLILMSAGGGSAIAWLEERSGIAPRIRVPGDRRLALRVVLWGLVVPVIWVPLAWIIAAISSPWGPEAIFKPSMQWRVLAAAILWLAPCGVAIGLARGLLERRFRIGAPLAFAATLPAIALAVLPGVKTVEFVHEGLLLAEVDSWPPGFGGDFLFYVELALSIFLFLVAAEYLSEGSGIRAFLLRSAVLAGVVAAALPHAEVLNSMLPVAVRQRIAYDQAARGDDAAAARSWRWILRRSPDSAVTCRAVEQCAMAAIRGGRPQEARDALEQIDARLAAEFPCAAIEQLATALLATPLETTGAAAAAATPVRPETYLDASWSAVLSAVRAALPEVSEAQIKDRLRKLSTDSLEIELPRMNGFDDLRTTVRRLGCEAFAAPAEEIGGLLAQGRPVLFRDPLLRRWGLMIWRAPGSDAVVWLDYSRWDTERERPLTGTEVRQLLHGDDRLDPGRGEVSAEVRALGSESLLRARLARDGGWVAVVVPAPEGEAPVPEGADVHLGDLLVRIWEGRHSVESGAYLVAAGLAGRLPPGPASSEILEIGMAGDESREPPLPGRPLPAPVESSRRDWINPAAIARLSPWALRSIVNLGARISDLGCEIRRLALERLVLDLPDDAALLEELLDQALASEEESMAVRAAMDLARARSFETASVLRALEVTAPLAADLHEAKDAVAFLLARLPPMAEIEDDAFPVRPRKSLAPYCAGRAALADRPQSASRWWRRAVEIDPLRPAYRIRLAESLEALGDSNEADRQRRAARDLEQVPSCGPSRSLP
jgi:hypothetical protein